MYKVGICGHFAIGHELVNGQIDKTKSVYKALAKALGEEQITILDTRGWKKNPLKLFLNCRKMLSECENIIMLPAHGGVRIFPLLFEKLNVVVNKTDSPRKYGKPEIYSNGVITSPNGIGQPENEDGNRNAGNEEQTAHCGSAFL